ncbi:DNA-directed RNA polymerase subunit beta [Gracilibacillus salitolerans]|uniref:DNA-directed RNA polymerase subunit beta n=1 Tax=Gracilibacillus salitolerans TaxID=2663022 RepID=A0A5Q2TMY8_9BACI|nr:DNA-directed RNA polymerase subunit beta [Gracilibacillus salitolerans]QGH36324.1 DNA-directed RNA polymerase subunit beta [Gracilibacillus salitolerans]
MSQETKSNNTKKVNEKKQAQTKTNKEKRADRKKQKQEERKYVRRLIPIWAKVMIVVLLSLFALMIGLIIGFSILGDGSPLDVLKWETWQHIIDYVKED